MHPDKEREQGFVHSLCHVALPSCYGTINYSRKGFVFLLATVEEDEMKAVQLVEYATQHGMPCL